MEDAIEGWGSVYGQWNGSAGTPAATLSNPFAAFPISAGSKRRMLTQLLCPFLTSTGKMLPLSLLGGITIELELGDIGDCFYADTTHAQLWEISQPEILIDTLSVDPSLSNSYASALLSGKSLPISYHNFFSFETSVASSTAASIPIQRGFSRLSAVYITFTRAGQPYNSFFYCPLEMVEPTVANDTFHYSYQLGSQRCPTYDVRSISESFYRLRKAQLMTDGTDSFGITMADYCNSKFIAAFSMDKAHGSGMAHTGANTMGGNMLVLNLYNMGADVSTCHIVCHYDCVLSITSGGNELAF